MAGIIPINTSKGINWTDANADDIQTKRHGYSHHPIGIIMIIVIGLAVWLLGFRLIKVIVIAAAFILCGWSFFMLSPHFLHLDVCCAEGTPVQVRIAVSIIVALMAGAIACFVYKLGLFCLGSCLGLILAVAGAALVLTKILHSPLAYYGMYGGFALLVGILAVVFEKIFVILGTSVVGSLAVMYGIDYFVKTPFTHTMLYALDQMKGGLHDAVNNPSEFHLHWHGTLTDKTIAMYLGWLLMTLVGFYIQFVYTSQEISSYLMVKACGGNQADYCEQDEPLTPQHPISITIVELLALAGVVMWAAGYRLIKPCMFLAAFALSFLIFYVVSPMIFRTKVCCGPRGIEWVHLLVSSIVGVFGGFLGSRLYRLGVFTIGECLGMVVALTILSTPLYVYFKSNTSYGCFMATISLIFGSLAHFFEKPILVLSTTSSGSFCFLYGVDYFLRSSFSVTVESFLLRVKDVVEDGVKSEISNWTYRAKVPDHMAVRFTPDAVPMFIAWGVSVAIGVAVQFQVTARNIDGRSNFKDYVNCCGPKPDK